MPTRTSFGSGMLDLYKLGLVIGGNRREVIYVNPNAAGGNDGRTWEDAYTTMTKAFARVQSNGIVMFIGNVREQCSAPANIFDVTIIGCGNRPRHSDLVAAGYEDRSQTSATWLAPVTASLIALTPVMTVKHQGWTFVNILFTWKSDSGTADAALVKLVNTAGAGAAEIDAGHASFIGCRFDGGLTGIEDAGGATGVLIDDCFFRGITDGTGRAIYCSSTAVRNPLNWEIRNSRFSANDNHIIAAASGWFVHDNFFSSASVTKAISFAGGVAGNIVTRNYLSGTYDDTLYTDAGGADEWAGNYNVLAGGITASDP